MSDYQTCPNCNTPLVNGVAPVNDFAVQAINLFTSNKSTGFCSKCIRPLFAEAKSNRVLFIEEKNKQIQADLPFIPVITLQYPLKWDYVVLKMVTAQSVTGEGALTEFTSAFSELFGTQSTRLNNKLKNGENICFAQLRAEALIAGGNAVIATDIDYAEVGGIKGMLMVCMSGTAIKLNNIEILPAEVKGAIDRINQNINVITLYNKYATILT